MELFKYISEHKLIRSSGSIWVLVIMMIVSFYIPTAASTQTRVPVITAAPNSTATATPFQPLLVESSTTEVLETPTAQVEKPIWGDYPAPQVFPYYLGIPSPAEIIPQPKGQTNILLLGSDQRPYEGGFLNDTMILITLIPYNYLILT